MVDWENQRRVPVACVGCGSVFVAVELQDGDIKPLGTASECSVCGESDFEPLDDPFESSSGEDADIE